MNIGRLIEGPGDLGYDPKNWVEDALAVEAGEAESWLEQLNNDAALNQGAPGVSARRILGCAAAIVRGN